MAWSKQQKATAVIACKAAGIADEHRKLILRQFAAAMYDAQGNPTDQPSSTSKRLGNVEFEQFMAIVERAASGTIRTPGRTYPADHWAAKADDSLQRVRHLAREIATSLESAGLLDANGAGLAGWIRERVTKGRTDRLDELEYVDLHKLINGLRAYGSRNGVSMAV